MATTKTTIIITIIIPVHIFHNEKYKQYCAKGEWVGKQAGGTFRPQGDKESSNASSSSSSTTAAAAAGSVTAGVKPFLKNLPSTSLLVDGDPYWFNNPQYRYVDRSKRHVSSGQCL